MLLIDTNTIAAAFDCCVLCSGHRAVPGDVRHRNWTDAEAQLAAPWGDANGKSRSRQRFSHEGQRHDAWIRRPLKSLQILQFRIDGISLLQRPEEFLPGQVRADIRAFWKKEFRWRPRGAREPK